MLVALDRALDRWCSTALRIKVWKRVMVLASRVKVGIRLRRAQEIQPASSALASGSSAWKIMRSCSFQVCGQKITENDLEC